MILFCAATGIEHVAVGILAHAMQSMAVRGFIKHDRESGAYALTDSGRAVLTASGRYSRRAKHILRLIGCQAAHPSFFIGRLFEISPKQP